MPSPGRHDALFAEARRVVRPGGVLAGCDELDGRMFRLMHLGDTCVPTPPETAADRLRRVGFADVEIGTTGFRIRGRTAE